ncbi:hypothetical protein IL54_2458 [Sphingobium sp. ba1]|jgi:hypothetical protein|nr:hypothetical protein IL54_2458 [Sphingobium sp. ba1]
MTIAPVIACCHQGRMTAILFRPLTVALCLLLPACASLSPESRLRAGLVEAGLAPKLAGCMAEKMTDRLSLTQLRRLQSLASVRKSHIGTLGVDQWLHKVRALGDAEIFLVTSKAAVGCTF